MTRYSTSFCLATSTNTTFEITNPIRWLAIILMPVLPNTDLGVTRENVDFWSISFTIDHYINLYKRWYFAYSFSGWYANKDELPYLLTPAFGYLGMEIRGYELFLINGQQLGLFQIQFQI